MIIRSMLETDIAEVALLEKEIFSDYWSEDAFYKSLMNKDQIFLVAEIDGRIAAYCGMWCVLDEGQILNIAVAPDYRRRGLGEKLLSALIMKGIMRNLIIFSLEVREGNTAAINLYSKHNFCRTGLRKNYYCKPVEDAVLMDMKIK